MLQSVWTSKFLQWYKSGYSDVTQTPTFPRGGWALPNYMFQAENCFPTRKHFPILIEHICRHDLPWQIYETIIMSWSMLFMTTYETSLVSQYRFLSWMGTLTVKSPDRALDVEEPMQTYPVEYTVLSVWWCSEESFVSCGSCSCCAVQLQHSAELGSSY